MSKQDKAIFIQKAEYVKDHEIALLFTEMIKILQSLIRSPFPPTEIAC